jgi:hypothetical protein
MVKSGSGVKHMRKHIDWSEQNWLRYEQITGQLRPERFRKSEQAG